jgi:hypothetical protein
MARAASLSYTRCLCVRVNVAIPTIAYFLKRAAPFLAERSFITPLGARICLDAKSRDD